VYRHVKKCVCLIYSVKNKDSQKSRKKNKDARSAYQPTPEQRKALEGSYAVERIKLQMEYVKARGPTPPGPFTNFDCTPMSARG